jgi:hypothetical protein
VAPDKPGHDGWGLGALPIFVLFVFFVANSSRAARAARQANERRQSYIPINSALRTVFMTMRIEAASTMVPLTLTEPRPSARALS